MTVVPKSPDVVQSDLAQDLRAIAMSRGLILDAVHKAGGGHTGSALGLTPLLYGLYQHVLNHDPQNPHWYGRDRVVLSVGHASLAHYVQLLLAGYDLDISDLKRYRELGSRTPTHPEVHLTPGVEMTTGSLGLGLAMSVGLAMESVRLREMLDSESTPGQGVFDYHVFVVSSDGDMQEGVASEAASLAGHRSLSNLTVVYDANGISLDGATSKSFTEDVAGRFTSYGWLVYVVEDGNDVEAIVNTLFLARDSDRPSLVILKTVIGWPAPSISGTPAAHGGPYGDAETRATKIILGLDPDAEFALDADIIAYTKRLRKRATHFRELWDRRFAVWQREHESESIELSRLEQLRMPEQWDRGLPEFTVGSFIDARTVSGQVMAGLASTVPEFWGGAADLSDPCATYFLHSNDAPAGSQLAPRGVERYIHFGVREHAMAAAVAGISLGGLTRPFAATMLAFSGYMMGAVRMAALMRLPAIFLWTHDSIGVGADGPTHQPIEQIASLRALPGLDVIRPSDAAEVVASWRAIMNIRDRPVALLLSNVKTEVLDRSATGPYTSATLMTRGAYTLIDTSDGGSPSIILIATGSEVRIALRAREKLEAEYHLPTRVVSMPCVEWFRCQDRKYRESVLPSEVRARLSIEAGSALGWHEWVGSGGRVVSVDDFSVCGDSETLFRLAGIEVEKVVREALDAVTERDINE